MVAANFVVLVIVQVSFMVEFVCVCVRGADSFVLVVVVVMMEWWGISELWYYLFFSLSVCVYVLLLVMVQLRFDVESIILSW